MKNAFFLIFLLMFGSFLGAQEGIINGKIDLSRSLAEFTPGKIPPGPTIYGLIGAVGPVKIINEEPATFKAEAELLEAQWVNAKELVGYKSILQFQGPSYAEVVTASRRNAEPNQITEHRKVIVFARLNGYRGTVPVFEILYHKIIN